MLTIICCCLFVIYYFYPENDKIYVNIGYVLYEDRKCPLQCKKSKDGLKHRIYRKFKSSVYIKDKYIIDKNQLVETEDHKLCRVLEFNKEKYKKLN